MTIYIKHHINESINEEIFNYSLDETYDSISEIKQLANDVIKKIASNNFKLLEQNKYIGYLYGIYLNTIDSSKYNELKDFIDNTVIYIYINNMNKKGLRGNYSTYMSKNYNPKIEREITIFVDDVKKLFIEISKDFREKSNYSEKDMYFKLFHSLYSVLIHELQHAYDDYRSKNKIYQTSKYNKFLSFEDKLNRERVADNLEQEKDNEIVQNVQQNLRYLNLQHEVWARFTQALYHTHFTSLEFTDDGGHYFEMKPLKDVVKDFTRNYEHFKHLNDGMKRKLVNKIAQFWHIENEKLKYEKQ